MRKAQRYGSWAFTLICFLLDRMTKSAALYYLVPAVPQPLFSLFGISCQLNLTTNTGAAWGMLFHSPLLLLLLRISFLLILGYIYYSTAALLSRVALLAVLAGASSNILDTLLWGHVIDMIHFSFWGWDYPVFNIADICICIGSLVFFFSLYTEKQK